MLASMCTRFQQPLEQQPSFWRSKGSARQDTVERLGDLSHFLATSSAVAPESTRQLTALAQRSRAFELRVAMAAHTRAGAKSAEPGS